MTTRANVHQHATRPSYTPNPYGRQASDEDIASFNEMMAWTPEIDSTGYTTAQPTLDDALMDVDTAAVPHTDPLGITHTSTSTIPQPLEETLTQSVPTEIVADDMANPLENEMNLALRAIPKIYVHPLLPPIGLEIAFFLNLRCCNNDMSSEEVAILAAETPEQVAVNPITLALKRSPWSAAIDEPGMSEGERASSHRAQAPGHNRAMIAGPVANAEVRYAADSRQQESESDSDDDADLEPLFDKKRAKKYQIKRNRMDMALESSFAQAEGNSPLPYEWSSPWMPELSP